jgi:hypothetical protein
LCFVVVGVGVGVVDVVDDVASILSTTTSPSTSTS